MNTSRWAQIQERASFYASQHLAPSSREAYSLWVERFHQFCAQFGFPSFPLNEDTLAGFLCDLADDDYVFSSIRVAFSAIRNECETRRLSTSVFDSVFMQRVLAGLRRTLGDGPLHPAGVLTIEHIRRMAIATDLHPTPAHRRSIAMIAVGFFGLLRRSEVVQIRRSHITFRPDGMVIRVPRSKTDQTRVGHELFISQMPGSVLCPVFRLRIYLSALPSTEEVVFGQLRNPSVALSPASVGYALQQLLELADVDRSGFSAHSLRRGGACALAAAGIPDDVIRAFGRWHPDSQVYRRYIQGSARPGLTGAMIQAGAIPPPHLSPPPLPSPSPSPSA